MEPVKDHPRKCKECGKTLLPIGNARKNGKCHGDWDTREYHKKCFKQIINNRIFNSIYLTNHQT